MEDVGTDCTLPAELPTYKYPSASEAVNVPSTTKSEFLTNTSPATEPMISRFAPNVFTSTLFVYNPLPVLINWLPSNVLDPVVAKEPV
jgi:hypothetical protein